MSTHTYTRAHTHTRYPHERYETAEISFDGWNYSYEIWLGMSYADDIQPFFNAPSGVFTKYTTPFGVSLRTDMLRLLKTHIDMFSTFAEYSLQTVLFEMWRKMDYRKRRDLCLKIWENQVRRCEKQVYPFRRDECPEIILKNVAGNVEFLEDLFHQQISPPAGTDYRIVRNEAWERLNDPNFGGGERLTGLSAGVRGFVEEGYIARHLYLAQFTSLWIDSLLGKPLPDLNNPSLASSYQATEADVQALKEMQIAGHPVRTTDMLDNSGVKFCVVCKVTDREKKLVCCQKCLAARRKVWYCGANCQRQDWPSHKRVCGKSIDEASTPTATPSSTRAPANPNQAAHLDYLELHPRAIFGMSGQSEDHLGRVTELDFLFYLPTFVRPFFKVHEALIKIRDVAVRQRDDFSVGVVALYMLAAAKYAETTKGFDSGQVAGLLEPLMDMTQKEVEKAMAFAEAELATTEDESLLLVASALRQLKSGVPDPTYPDLNLPSTLSTLEALDRLLIEPNTFFVHWFDPNKPKHLASLNFPPPFRNAENPIAARRLCLDALETQDPLSVGALQLLVRGCTRYKADVPGSYMMDLRMWARFGRMIGRTEEQMRELRDKAEVELPKREEERWRFVWELVSELREFVKKERENEPPPPWTPPGGNAWPRTAAEVMGNSVYGPEGPLPSASPTATTSTSTAAAKKKNRKKKKKATGGSGAGEVIEL
ncbi:hypothetical protein JCM6882_009429 [Rhodosporidiobolus microsporus]